MIVGLLERIKIAKLEYMITAPMECIMIEGLLECIIIARVLISIQEYVIL